MRLISMDRGPANGLRRALAAEQHARELEPILDSRHAQIGGWTDPHEGTRNEGRAVVPDQLVLSLPSICQHRPTRGLDQIP
ncbi:hypothetical protein Poly30_49330 [Planctomycetes bacterium Poly30]|uniref:Uncharacterized protein n=1 Tax=Saltatorellus ferox TaxID=2528018 RepID=A0A518EZ56_9BACT|nr:hypothetical protein Poly30_49330 [Planctomycetes bacterium Poly30]